MEREVSKEIRKSMNDKSMKGFICKEIHDLKKFIFY